MSILATPAVLLRRVDYGDFDLILTLFTETTGKISVIAKHAKKSKKRFAGVLELFTVLKITCFDFLKLATQNWKRRWNRTGKNPLKFTTVTK